MLAKYCKHPVLENYFATISTLKSEVEVAHMKIQHYITIRNKWSKLITSYDWPITVISED